MERFHPSQIDWIAFENRNATSSAQLWPPSGSICSRETTTVQHTAPTTPNTSVSDRIKNADTDRQFLASPHLYPEYVRSIESLRSFVEREIGVLAIDNRLSIPVLDEGSSTWSTIDSSAINLATWTKEQASRLNCDERCYEAHGQRDCLKLRERSESTNRSPKRNLMLKLKGKYLIQKGSVKSRLKAIVANIRNGFNQVVGGS